ncbi:MAG: hypothetical protein KR126chlam5_00804 [Candidatus Anoxychlamydiales bacterium]|nr:hypothetical protein [Candidatus Anoxychlamydiales bacterium]
MKKKVLKQIKLKKDWKFYTGLVCLILSFFLPLLGFVVPFLKLPTTITVGVITFLTIGGPEAMILAGSVLLGKDGFRYYRNKMFLFFKRKSKPKPVSEIRYYTGLTIMVLSVIPLYLNAYFSEIMPQKEYTKNAILISADLIFVISFFILGGEFWEKYKRLFIWDGNSPQTRNIKK